MKDLQKNWKLILWCIFLSIAIPIITSLIATLHIFPIETSNDWIGFYGSYFGALLGGFVTLYGIKLTFENEKRKELKEKENSILPNLALRIKPFGEMEPFTQFKVEVVSVGKGTAYSVKMKYYDNKIYLLGTIISGEKLDFKIEISDKYLENEFLLEFQDEKGRFYHQYYDMPYVDRTLEKDQYIELYGCQPKIVQKNKYTGIVKARLYFDEQTFSKLYDLNWYQKAINEIFVQKDYPVKIEEIVSTEKELEITMKLTRSFPYPLILRAFKYYIEFQHANLEVVEGDTKLL